MFASVGGDGVHIMFAGTRARFEVVRPLFGNARGLAWSSARLVWLPLMIAFVVLRSQESLLAGRLDLGETVLIVTGFAVAAFLSCLFVRTIGRTTAWAWRGLAGRARHGRG